MESSTKKGKCTVETPQYCDEASIIAKYAMTKSINMILSALIGGFALSIAILFSTPISQAILNSGWTSDPIIAAIITAVIFFVICLVLVVIMIFVNRYANKIKAIAKADNYILE